ncbi:MAG: RHS repeat-associated core domain-containing protein, partial [Gammaproteobacteria bacterium]|nr:RHS repeat-associated core domain-containing protein [Gammaproteobacteria bacterium]
MSKEYNPVMGAGFVYDALGRRESKTLNGTSTNFLYDGLNLEQELNGTTPTVNYLTGPGIDEAFSRTDSTGSYNYLTDNLGSSLALTNSTGAISTSYTYEPYGNTTASGASSTNALQYTGRENDGDGLYYYRARYYSPGYGRFISEDPLGLGAGVNEYDYVFSDPMNLIDPLGLCPNKKNDCVHKTLQQYYGNFAANTLVPDFSLLSIAHDFEHVGEHVLIVGIPISYGAIRTITGNNLKAYPGMSQVAADALENGAFWRNTAHTLGDVGFVFWAGAAAFATTADIYARIE